ncbi:UCHL3 (predicted) [Pycnogonum litorale]
MASTLRWVPLESNPDVMNTFLQNLGVPSAWKIVDVFGLDDELLMTIPQPVVAVILLFPKNDQNADYIKNMVESIQESGQEVNDSVYFSRQTIGNACGTMALIHAVANNTDKVLLDESKPLKKFLELTKAMSPEERGKTLEKDEGICAAHEASAQEGQTAAPDRSEKVDLHFVAFVEKEGHLYELDGNCPFAINHGPSSPETLVKVGLKIFFLNLSLFEVTRMNE